MPLLHSPQTLLQQLRDYDPTLRCRWSDARQAYLIERRIGRGQWINPTLDPEVIRGKSKREDGSIDPEMLDDVMRDLVEEYRAASDGYTILFEVDADCADDRLFFHLFKQDIPAQGGADRVNDKIDRDYHMARTLPRTEFLDFVRQEAKAAYRYMNRPHTVPEKYAHTAHGRMTR